MRIYHGWIVVAASCVAYMLVLGMTVNSFGLFVIPVSAELGLSRATMNTAPILFNVGNGLTAALIGRLLVTVPARTVLLAAALLMALGFSVLGLSSSLLLSAIALGILLPLGANASAIITLNVLVTRWFVAHRARAMTLSTLGMSLGGAVAPPIVAVLVERCGWRVALFWMGASLALTIACIAGLVRERPGRDEAAPRRNESTGEGVASADHGPLEASATVGQLLRTPEFWSVSLNVSLLLGMLATLSVSMIPWAVGEGVTTMQATSLVAVSGGTSIVANLLLAAYADRMDRGALLCGLFVLIAPAIGVLIYVNSYPWMVACAAVQGAAAGLIFPLFQSRLVDRFGVASFGTVRGLTIPINAVACAIGMRFAGEVYDRCGSYTPAFATFVCLSLLSAAWLQVSRTRERPRVLRPCRQED